jgi:hypothetical protein
MADLRQAAQQALQALEFMADEWGFTQKANRPERWQAIDALRAALAQQEQEPVAWRYQNANTDHVYLVWNKGTGGRNWTPLFTAPPRREWQGLTEEEREQATGWSVEHIEAKLKEKNQ